MNPVRYELVEVNSLTIDPDYQRSVSHPHAKKIVKNFDESLLGTIVVSERDGSFYVIDGQHRVMACRNTGTKRITAQIISGMTKQQEAEHFRLLNQSRKGLSALDVFEAEIVAEDPVAMTVKDVVERNGFSVEKGKRKDVISSPTTCKAIVNKYGEERFDLVLSILKKAWNGDNISLTAYLLNGVADFIEVYGADPHYSDKKFADQLAKVSPEQVLREIKSDVSTKSLKVRQLNILLKYYNLKLIKKLDGKHYNL